MTGSAVVHERPEQQTFDARVNSIMLVRVPNGEKITFYKRDHDAERGDEPTEFLTVEELCSIAANYYIDCPRMPIAVIGQSHRVVLVRSLMRSARILTLLELENADTSGITQQGDGARFDVMAFDSVSEAIGLSAYSKILEFPMSPYHTLSCEDNFIERYIRAAARFVECTLTVTGAEHSDINSTQDVDVINAILLLLLILLKRTANEGSIELELKQSDRAPILCLRTVLRCGAEIVDAAELAECIRIASARNMMFDYFFSDDNSVSFEFCPRQIEWSHLGIKTHPVLEYDE